MAYTGPLTGGPFVSRLAPALWLAVTTALAGPGDPPASAPAPFACCDNVRVQRIVDDYVDLVTALADDTGRAGAHAYALRSNLQPDSGLTPPENLVIQDLHHQVDAVKNAGDEGIRAALGAIGRGVIFLALRHEGGGLTIVEAVCPERGSWLQRDMRRPTSPWGGRCARWR